MTHQVTGRVLSVNVGAAEPNPARRGRGVTGFHKVPVPVAEVRPPGPAGSGLLGDVVALAGIHGGDRQAVYAFAREELDAWERELGRELPPGSFAENLTTTGVDVDGGRVGDVWTVGPDVVLQVTAPRTPCRTFSHRMGVPGWMRRFAEAGRPGAYLRILHGGFVHPGDAVTVVPDPEGELLQDVFRTLTIS